MSAVIWAVILLLFLFSFVGLVLPVIPGTILILIGFGLYHLFIDSQILGFSFWLAMILLTVLALVVDYLTSAVFVKKYGGSRAAFWAGVLGALLFPFVLGPVGLIIGPFVAVFIVEMLLTRDVAKAWKIGLASWLGFLGGNLLRAALHLVMIVWFLFLVL